MLMPTRSRMLKEELLEWYWFGAGTAVVLEETPSASEDGPLSTVAESMDALWAKFEYESPSDCYHDYLINLGNPGAVKARFIRTHASFGLRGGSNSGKKNS